MKSTYSYQYPRPALTADTVVFGFDGREAELKILLIERGGDPYMGKMALPGGFLEIEAKTDADGNVIEEKNETLEACACRELEEETGLKVNFMKEVGTFSTPGRDPRGVTVTDAFYALASPVSVRGGDDARKAMWAPLQSVLTAIDSMPSGMRFLAFDHDDIVRRAFNQLRTDICFEPVAFLLLTETFSMTQVQEIYQTILGKEFDRRNFARKVLMSGVLDRLVPVGRNVNYKLNRAKFEELKNSNRRLKLQFV
ncbi:MAG: NUDIX hydrolase [Bacteroidales bacterium]|nr:NUDIX hydrolase [Bacteroidales bacterium]